MVLTLGQAGKRTGGDEVCRAIEEMMDVGASLEEILVRTVDLLHNSNRCFHWTGIYELFPDDVLRLGPFIGAPTDHVFIAVGKGVCGTAVAENRNINVPDVSKAPDYLACSAATRSELVVLIRRQGTIYAQIDIDSHELNAFDPGTVAGVEKIADCLARAYALHRKPASRG
ncbi:MAG TPA: GAF domain-containing protein [Candidatus Dormibacteraeota bacterium]|nr:GAF domain-containing protein [Candidatus Dormibacteraeota bacterium]